jgi:hypothetical protein
MADPTGAVSGGTNDVRFVWDGSMKISVAASGQISNAVISSTCPFFGLTWSAHDLSVYGPGTYTVYAGCAAGSPGCGTGVPITFTVGAGQIGAHMLFNWGPSTNIDMACVFSPHMMASPMWTGACGSNPADKVWDWAGQCTPLVDGPFLGFNTNFNLMGVPPCVPAGCNDGNACTTDACVNGSCVHTAITCNDNNACTTDTCNTATGCVYTPINCNDNNTCTVDMCNTATGCVYTPIHCEHIPCSGDSCDPVTGCRYDPVDCSDGNACTTDFCDTTADSCVHTPINCNDGNVCTTDSCNPASGCVHTPISTDDNNACTTESCDPATGVISVPVDCNDNNACTVDSCDPTSGCVFAPKCAADESCDPLTGACGPACPADSVKSVTIPGGGQNPNSVDKQIMTSFTVMNGGCIVGWTKSSVTVTPGTILEVNVKAGMGPQPTYCTLNDVQIDLDMNYLLPIVGPDFSGGKLVCDNKDNGGKDADRMTISVQ